MSITRTIKIDPCKIPFDNLPAEFRKSFSAEEKKAFQLQAKYFEVRSKKCKYPAVKKYFRFLSESRFDHVYLVGGVKPVYRVYFDFYVRAVNRSFLVRLSSQGKLPGNPPKIVRDIYSDIGGINDNGFQYSGGWVPIEVMEGIRKLYFPFNDSEYFDTENCFPIVDFGNGDYVWYSSGKIAMFDHETGEFEPYDLKKYADQYFGDPVAFWTYP